MEDEGRCELQARAPAPQLTLSEVQAAGVCIEAGMRRVLLRPAPSADSEVRLRHSWLLSVLPPAMHPSS